MSNFSVKDPTVGLGREERVGWEGRKGSIIRDTGLETLGEDSVFFVLLLARIRNRCFKGSHNH